MSKKPEYNSYAKYSALAFQFLAVFITLALVGNYADKYFELSFPAFTLIGVLLGIINIFYTIHKIIQKND